MLDEPRVRALADGLAGADFAVRSVEEKPYKSSPRPPFMTSTLQQEGGRKLRLSSSQVMRLAQGLYERGYITYMRTDNVALSDEALAAVRAAVAGEYGQQYLSSSPRRYTSKVKNAQEAHEAIRPTTPLRPPQRCSGRAQLPGAGPVPDGLAAHARLADGRRHRHHGQRAASAPPPPTAPTPSSARPARRSRSPATARSTSSPATRATPRRPRRRGDPPAAHRRRRRARRRPRTPGPRHDAAGPLHRGVARSSAWRSWASAGRRRGRRSSRPSRTAATCGRRARRWSRRGPRSPS